MPEGYVVQASVLSSIQVYQADNDEMFTSTIFTVSQSLIASEAELRHVNYGILEDLRPPTVAHLFSDPSTTRLIPPYSACPLLAFVLIVVSSDHLPHRLSDLLDRMAVVRH